MKELEEFIHKYTNADVVYDEGWRYEDVTVLELELNVPQRYPRHLVYYVELGLHKDDQFALMVDCVPTHPVIAMQIMMEELRDVSFVLQDINIRIGAQSLYLDEIIGVEP